MYLQETGRGLDHEQALPEFVSPTREVMKMWWVSRTRQRMGMPSVWCGR